MRYHQLVLDTEEGVIHFQQALNDLDEDMIDEFEVEVIEHVLEYAADKESARSSIGEFVRECADLYSTMSLNRLEAFKSALATFAEVIYQSLLLSDAYDDHGQLYARFDRYFGNDIVIKRMSDDERAATYIAPGN